MAFNPWRIRIGTDPHGPAAGSAAERRAAQHRGLSEAGQGARLLGQWVDVPVGVGAGDQAQTLEAPPHPRNRINMKWSPQV